MVKLRLEKSSLPKMAAISGVRRSRTTALTTAPKATPMTTAIARSTTLPRNRNALKSRASLTTSMAGSPNAGLMRMRSSCGRRRRLRARGDQLEVGRGGGGRSAVDHLVGPLLPEELGLEPGGGDGVDRSPGRQQGLARE